MPIRYRPGLAVTPPSWTTGPRGRTPATSSQDRSGRYPVAQTIVAMSPSPRRADSGGGHRRRGRREPLRRVGVDPGRVGPGVEGVEQPAQLEVGQRAHVGQRPGELRHPVADAGEPADQPHPERGQRVEVEGRPLRRADQLHRRQVAGPEQVRNLVVALVEQARRVHPPQDVPAPVGPRHPHVLADGERDRPPGAVQLLGDLDPARRGADDQHAAVGQPVGVAVVRGGHRGDPGGHPLGQPGGHVGDRGRPRGDHHRRARASCPGRSAPRSRPGLGRTDVTVVLVSTGAADSVGVVRDQPRPPRARRGSRPGRRRGRRSPAAGSSSWG